MQDSLRAVVADLLVQLRARAQDTTWSNQQDEASLVGEVERLAVLAMSDETSAVRGLRLLFAPMTCRRQP